MLHISLSKMDQFVKIVAIFDQISGPQLKTLETGKRQYRTIAHT